MQPVATSEATAVHDTPFALVMLEWESISPCQTVINQLIGLVFYFKKDLLWMNMGSSTNRVESGGSQSNNIQFRLCWQTRN